MTGTLLGACCLLAAAVSSACAPSVAVAPPEAPSTASWRAARERLASLRRQTGSPRTLRIALGLREPITGRLMNARGAIALDPPDSLRMVMLGPGGTTALDLWVEQDRFRFAVPALDLMRRGDGATPRESMRGLPVDFLSWWLLRPFEGKLLHHQRTASGDRFVLRHGAAVIDLQIDAAGVRARRRSARGEGRVEVETVTAGGFGCVPARYQQAPTGLDISIRCEGEESRPPNPRAFVDPDLPVPDEEAMETGDE
jgi:hypothetical protein